MKAGAAVNVFVQMPCVALRPFIKRFFTVEFPSAHQDSHLPDTGPVAVFRFKGDCILDGGMHAPQTAFTGLRDSLRRHLHGRDSAAVLVAFTATGAEAFLRCSLDEVFNATVDMDDVLGQPAELKRIHDRLAGARNNAQRIRIVESFLLTRAVGARPDAFVSAAASRIEETRAMVRIEELARRVGLSQSALERRFRRAVGTSPRKFASIVRLQHVVRLRAAGNDFTTIAFAAGYCDQPHFIKDFKRFTGVAPESFFKRTPVG
jgi:AraC-like DNA-binding protein